MSGKREREADGEEKVKLGLRSHFWEPISLWLCLGDGSMGKKIKGTKWVALCTTNQL